MPEPRIPPVDEDRFSEVLAESFDGVALTRDGNQTNISRTWANHPALMKAQRPVQVHFKSVSELPKQEMELAILRMGWLCQSEYEFGQHVISARRVGLTTERIEAVKVGPSATVWSPIQRAVIQAVDEMYSSEHRVGDETWKQLSEHFSTQQLIDLVAVVGRYWSVSVTLRTLGVPLEAYNHGFEVGEDA